MARALGGRRGDEHDPREFDGKVTVERFDAEADLWRQTWVDDNGSYFALTGGTDGDTFALAMSTMRGGVPIELRMVFCEIEADSFRWLWERSRDDGATWDPAWEIAYARTG